MAGFTTPTKDSSHFQVCAFQLRYTVPSLLIMHTFEFSLIAALSCIARVSAVPIGNSVPAGTIVHRQDGLGADVGSFTSELKSPLNGPGALGDASSGEPGTVRCSSGGFIANAVEILRAIRGKHRKTPC